MVQRRGNVTFRILACMLYVACVAGVVFGMNCARSHLLAVYGSEQAQGNWQNWRDAASADVGPVERDEPVSDVPPAFVLMRHHFRTCLAFSLLLTTVLFVTLLIMIRGAFFYQRPAADVDESRLQRR